MSQILQIDTSPRGDRSVSRSLTQHFVQGWQAAHPEDAIVYRDLGHQPVPHVDEAWVVGSFAPPEQQSPEAKAAIQISDDLVDEFLAADRLVVGVPMYNLTVPSTLKAYIDQIVRVGRTFGVNEQGYVPLVHGKKLLVITARGGLYAPGTPAHDADFQEPYLRAIFGFMGVTDATFIHAEGINYGDEAREKGIASAKAAIEQAIANW